MLNCKCSRGIRFKTAVIPTTHYDDKKYRLIQQEEQIFS